MQTSTAHRLLWGIVVVTIGVVFLLNQVGIISLDIGELVGTYWPVLLILFGLQGLLLQHGGGFWWNSLTVIIGGYFLGRNLGLLEWGVSDMIRILVPIAIILFGINLIFRSNSPSCKKQKDFKGGQWNPIHPTTPPIPPVPPMPPGPPPVPPELEEFERRNPVDLSKKARNDFESSHYANREDKARERSDDSEYDGWNHGHEHKDWWKNHDWKRYGKNHDWKRYARDNHSRFIGDMHFGNGYWELRPMNISNFIGDTTLDLTKAQISLGETRVYVSSFIGDVKVFVPNDLSVGLKVESSCLIGDVKVLDQKRGGLFNQMSVETPNYMDSDKRVVLIVSSLIGDVRVTKVG